MAYTPQEKKEFALKDAKYSIGMSRGNSLAKAVDLLIGTNTSVPMSDEDIENFVFKWADKFHHFNQVSIERDFAKWREINEERINEELGMQIDFEKNIKNVNDENFFKTSHKTS